MSKPPLLIQVSPAELPEEYRRLVDPDIPLAEPERFLPEPFQGSIFAKVGLAAVVVFILATANSLVRSLIGVVQSGEMGDWGNLALSIGIQGVLAWFAWRLWRRLRIGREQAAAHAKGRYREGFFLTPDALLVYYHERCDLVPREQISIDWRQSSTPSGGARPSTAYFVFRDAQNREQLRMLLNKNARNQRVSQHTWLKNGEIFVMSNAGL